MKRIIRTSLVVALGVMLYSCCCPKEKVVMARFVPERADDFVWENKLVAYRAYGQALEHELISPGFDVWVKDSARLCANEWYEMDINKRGSYHAYHRGKDCYKVAVSLGAGASAPVVDGKFVFPSTNYRSWEIIQEKNDKVVFSISYPEWNVGGKMIGLTKTITVTPDTYFFKCVDSYTGDFDSLTVAAGLLRHSIVDKESGIIRSQVVEQMSDENMVVLWEEASDQSHEKEDALTGVAVYMPNADCAVIGQDVNETVLANSLENHALTYKTIRAGESIEYYFGSCWSKGDIKTFEAWKEMCLNIKK